MFNTFKTLLNWSSDLLFKSLNIVLELENICWKWALKEKPQCMFCSVKLCSVPFCSVQFGRFNSWVHFSSWESLSLFSSLFVSREFPDGVIFFHSCLGYILLFNFSICLIYTILPFILLVSVFHGDRWVCIVLSAISDIINSWSGFYLDLLSLFCC